jgi:hypothetical protein
MISGRERAFAEALVDACKAMGASILAQEGAKTEPLNSWLEQYKGAIEHAREMLAPPSIDLRLNLIQVPPIGHRDGLAFVDWHEGDEPRGSVEKIGSALYSEADTIRGRALREKRVEAGWNMGHAARHFGITVVEWSQLERGALSLSAQQWAHVFDTFNRQSRIVTIPVKVASILIPVDIGDEDQLAPFRPHLCEACKDPDLLPLLGYPPRPCDMCGQEAFGEKGGWKSAYYASLCRACAIQHAMCPFCGNPKAEGKAP